MVTPLLKIKHPWEQINGMGAMRGMQLMMRQVMVETHFESIRCRVRSLIDSRLIKGIGIPCIVNATPEEEGNTPKSN